MDFDRLLTVLGVLIGLIGILIGIAVAYYFYRKTIQRKRLAYAYTKPVSLQLPLDDVPPEYLQGGKEPSRVLMLLWNRGTAPIEKSDFVEPIKILPTEKVLRIKAHERYGASEANIDQPKKSISIKLLRPEEAIIFLIDADDPDFNPEIVIVMKRTDASVFLRSAPTEVREMIAIGAGGATFATLVALLTIIWAQAGPHFAEGSLAQTAVSFASGLIASILGIWLGAWVRKRVALWRLTPPLPYKFFELQKTFARINGRWASLHEESRGLMAAG